MPSGPEAEFFAESMMAEKVGEVVEFVDEGVEPFDVFDKGAGGVKDRLPVVAKEVGRVLV